MNDYLRALDLLEETYLATLRETTAQAVTVLSDNKFRYLLLQRGLIAMQFNTFYNRALSGVQDQQLENALLWLAREEYPLNESNHRKAMIMDMQQIGINKASMLNARPTTKTRQTITSLDSLFNWDVDAQPAYDAKIATGLRCGMEVSVAEEYAIILDEISRRDLGLREDNSQFYVPHRDHDRKQTPLHIVADARKSHADVLTKSLQRLVSDERTYETAEHAMRSSYQTKIEFYSQF